MSGLVLKPYKLSPSSATNRVVATCCNTPMFLGFDDARHWVSAYRGSFHGDVPPLQMHICTKFLAAKVALPNDLPRPSGVVYEWQGGRRGPQEAGRPKALPQASRSRTAHSRLLCAHIPL